MSNSPTGSMKSKSYFLCQLVMCDLICRHPFCPVNVPWTSRRGDGDNIWMCQDLTMSDEIEYHIPMHIGGGQKNKSVTRKWIANDVRHLGDSCVCSSERVSSVALQRLYQSLHIKARSLAGDTFLPKIWQMINKRRADSHALVNVKPLRLSKWITSK